MKTTQEKVGSAAFTIKLYHRYVDDRDELILCSEQF
jgi:hypothetical protein